MKFIIFILSYVVSLSLNAANIVDVFGTDPRKSDDLIKNYGVQVDELATKLLKEMAKASKSGKKPNLLNGIYQNRIRLINNIKRHYGFSYVAFDTIVYPLDKTAYTTIEVINKNDKDRLRFVNKITKPSPKKPKHDLIEKMMEFQTIWGQLMLTNQFDKKETQCPVYHCLPGFTHPKLKDLFALFNASVIKEKELILTTIKNDANPERRTAAVYLMGHFDDPKEIISFLTSHIMDSDAGVRNAAMRVINETMRKAKLNKMNVLPFLSLLDSPHDTDRNKALYILSNAAKSQESKELIIRHGKDRLIALLRLKQPNNHEPSYTLLKEISGNDFGSHNFAAWEQWFLKMNNTKS